MPYRLFTLFVLVFYNASGQSSGCFKKSKELFSVIQQNHINAVDLNDNFSERIFTTFFSNLDPEKKYLTLQDLLLFERYRTGLDDALLTTNSPFLEEVSAVFEDRLKKYILTSNHLLTQKLDFKKPDSLTYFEFENRFSLDYASLQNERLRLLKFNILQYCLQNGLTEDKLTGFEQVEAKSKMQLIEKEKRAALEILNTPKGLNNFVCEVFMQSIALANDPHSSYFSADQFYEFQHSLSSEGLSFGLELAQGIFGELLITRLAPAGPAWKSNKIVVGDKLLSIQINSETFNAAQYELEEINEILGDPSVQEVQLELMHSNATKSFVSLTKDIVELSENILNGYVLSGSHKVGYVNLPSFYQQWEKGVGEGCANDVAKEILKLKKEKIDGLIIDLRFNGGGSMQEAFDLAGLFIDTGPLAILKEKNSPPFVARDMNRGTLYDGPLLLLINQLSASASELLAATLQDYNRAILVGTTSYGKATSQVIVPLKTEASLDTRETTDKKPDEFVKITTGKIYRITGSSYQKRGVRPDVYIQDLTEGFYLNERRGLYSLDADSIVKKTYYTAASPIPRSSLRSLSQSRSIDYSKKINTLNRKLSTPVSLEPTEFFDFFAETLAVLEDIKHQKSNQFKIQLVTYDDALHSVNDYKKEDSERLRISLEQSFPLQEAYNILVDYINIQKK